MPSGLPARVAVVCTLIFGVAIARAERRPVAVIDLSGDAKTAELARSFNPVLVVHPDLSPIPEPAVPVLLYGEFNDDDQTAVANAQVSKRTADEQLGRYAFDIAEQSAGNGISRLTETMPTTKDALTTYAQLSFITGAARLGIPRAAADAPRAFALAARLDPTFVPDAARYLPDVVQAFEAAKRKWTGTGTLSVGGIGHLWIDGKDRGTAPLDSIEVEAGPHVVWLTGPNRIPNAKEVLVETGKKARVEIGDTPASREDKVRRARANLKVAPDAAARAAAMKELAELVGVHDAVLLTSPNNKIVVQTWNSNPRAPKPGFSSLMERKSETPLEILAALAPPKPKAEPPVKDKPKPLVDNRRWYERRPYQASMVVGVVAAIIGGYYLYKYATDDTIFVDPDVGTGARIRW